MPPFLLALLLFVAAPMAALGAEKDTWAGVERVVAIGDVHGDYEQFVKALESAGLVDSSLKWTGGKTHLVQTGDVPDRGPDTRRVFDLLMKLEREARRAGGFVHPLIGNHEAMNVYGDLRYVSKGEYESFRTDNAQLLLNVFFDRHVEALKSNPPPSGLPKFDTAYRSDWMAKHPLGFAEHRQAFGPDGKYGKWIRDHNAILKIDDTLFVHGGISGKYAGFTPKVLNERIREELEDFRKLQGGVATDTDGPLWYRGLAQEPEEDLEGDLAKVLASYQVKRIVIGHTPTEGTIIPRFGSRVIMIDVGLSAAYGGKHAFLVIEQGKLHAVHRGKKLPLPEGGAGPALLAFLKQAAALDPAPSPLAPLIQQLETGQPVSASR